MKLVASEFEMRRNDKDRLFELLKLKKINGNAGIDVLGLDEAITRVSTFMDQDDVKVVQQMIADLKV